MRKAIYTVNLNVYASWVIVMLSCTLYTGNIVLLVTSLWKKTKVIIIIQTNLTSHVNNAICLS